MRKYTQLSYNERYAIEVRLGLKQTINEIALKKNRHRSTIYRELNRNPGEESNDYSADNANRLAKKRRRIPSNKIDTNPQLRNYLIQKLHLGWSPEQIRNRIKIDMPGTTICVESIYRYIFKPQNQALRKLLKSKRKKRLPHVSARYKKTNTVRKQMQDRHISLRPTIIESRTQLGHWEGDTVRFSNTQKGCVTTLVERVSKFLILRKNADKCAETITDNLFNTPTAIARTIKSITFDQGVEFSQFGRIEAVFKCPTYFCSTQSPWQRGTNENTNGRLRRFLPQNTQIDQLSETEIEEICEKMNNTPRKCLGYQTPAEVFHKMRRSAADPPSCSRA